MIAALVADATQLRAVAAGCEEEGVPLEASIAGPDDPPGAQARAREAAARSPLGLGVGGDAAGCVLVLATRPDLAYVADADGRAVARATARIAARRPV